jgi:hypothetical protein
MKNIVNFLIFGDKRLKYRNKAYRIDQRKSERSWVRNFKPYCICGQFTSVGFV